MRIMTKQQLTVYVLPECRGCARAQQIVRAVGQRCPHVEATVIDLSQVGAIRPSTVFSVPTYLLDGRVISLGNPKIEELMTRLMAEAGERNEHDRHEAGLPLED
jgi:alkyl hydroperoxide reductase subunit AhpF